MDFGASYVSEPEQRTRRRLAYPCSKPISVKYSVGVNEERCSGKTTLYPRRSPGGSRKWVVRERHCSTVRSAEKGPSVLEDVDFGITTEDYDPIGLRGSAVLLVVASLCSFGGWIDLAPNRGVVGWLGGN